jgi:xanthine/uracil/vitamin C permease (AzgA family)
MRSTGCDQVWFALGGLLLIGSLIQHNVKGGILIGIFVVSLITWYHEGARTRATCRTPPSSCFC